jgi:hypothetical protein
MGFRGTATFATASSDLATYTKINAADGVGDRRDKHSVLALFAAIAVSAGTPTGETCTVELALTNGTTVYARRLVTVTATARRTGFAGASGNYLCDVADADSDRNISDLIGIEKRVGSTKSELYWMVGMTAEGVTNFTGLTLWWQTEPAL